VFTVATNVSEELIASESFSTGNGDDYTTATRFVDSLNKSNLTGNVGFSAANTWNDATSLIRPISSVGLTHTLVHGITANGAAEVIPLENSGTRAAVRGLASAPIGTSFYMSGLVSMDGSLSNLDASESAAMGLIGGTSIYSWNIAKGMHLGLTKDSGGDAYLAAFAGGNTYALGGALTAGQASETQMIVLKVDINTDGSLDTLTAWTAQQGATELTDALSVSSIDTGIASDLDTFVLQGQGGADALKAGGVFLDEFRLGTTLQDVTSIPEPATIGMLGLGALFTILMRHRQSR